jgi:sigma-B regulation protein RsbU (phosphoserine phosphatase)
VGGDLYEVLRTEDGRVVVLLGDVSGKGIPAALFMAVTMTLVRTLGRQFREPDEILRRVSDALAKQNPKDMFVTLLCVVYDPREGVLSCASAGHPSPVLIAPGKPPALPITQGGGLAGLEVGLEVPCQKIELLSGESLVLYTDGVTEAFNAAGDMFGEEGLLAHLAADPGRTAAGTVSGLVEAIRRFTGEEPQFDDIAMIVLRRLP